MDLPEIITETWEGLALTRDDILPSLQYLAHKTQKPVSFRWFTEVEGYSDSSVSVRVFVHDNIAATYTPEAIVLNGQAHDFAPEQIGMAVMLLKKEWKQIRDNNGQMVALVDHNRIILPIEVTATNNDTAKAILAYVVENAPELLDFDVSDILRGREEALMKHFMGAFQSGARVRHDLRREELNQRQREAEQAYYTILNFERQKPILEEEVSLLNEIASCSSSSAGRAQAKALVQLQTGGLYSQVSLDQRGTLLATTSPVTISYDGWDFPMGRYEVSISPTGDVRIKALDEHPNAEYPHPHVSTNHDPCLGNIAADLAKLIGRMRLAEALQLLHTFLSSYNPDGPYERIGHFDPTGQYCDDEGDPCEDCDDKCAPYCIFSCEHNVDFYTCQDCDEYRSQYCYTECDHNENFERFHPCHDCEQHGSEECYLECQYNGQWQLQNPCDNCEEKKCLGEECSFHPKKEEVGHVEAK